MTLATLRGERLILRAPEEADAAAWLSHPRDPEIVRMFGGDPDLVRPKTAEQAQDWRQRLSEQMFGWVIDRDGVIGELLLLDPNAQDRRARLALGLFAPEFLGQGLGREAIRLVLGHAFADEADGGLGMNRVDLRVIAYNERAIRCYRACGFVEEGREREAARVAGRYHDDVIMGILAREFG